MTNNPLKDLACAKFLLMLKDLSGAAYSDSYQPGILRDRAHRWFFDWRHEEDFEWWCDAAGYEPNHVREKAVRIYESGLPMMLRAKPGEGKLYHYMLKYRKTAKPKKPVKRP